MRETRGARNDHRPGSMPGRRVVGPVRWSAWSPEVETAGVNRRDIPLVVGDSAGARDSIAT
jgi:hypothetical protein